MKDVTVYLYHIIEAIEEIKGYLSENQRDLKTRRAVERCLEIIGEAANRVPEGIRYEYRDIPWKDIVGQRHVIIHDYDDLRPEIIWNTAQTDLPVLEKQIKQIIHNIEIIKNQ